MQVSRANNTTADTDNSEPLLALLGGLPLAIAQAGAYLQESGVGLTTYLSFYEQQWSELMESDHLADTPLQDYPDRSVWTTWAISYQAIRDKHEATANLLLVWSFLDNKDLWHSLFAAACRRSPVTAKMLSWWIGDIASNELAFSRAMQLLRNYSFVESVGKMASYAIHPVLHRWAYHSQGKQLEKELGRVAVNVIGWAVPDQSDTNQSAFQSRLLPHAQGCSLWMLNRKPRQGLGGPKQRELCFGEGEKDQTLLVAIRRMGVLYANQGQFAEAASLHEQTLRGKEEVLGSNHILTLETVGSLGNVYMYQGKLEEAEHMFKRALQGFDEVLPPKHALRLRTIGNLGMVYKKRGKLVDAEPLLTQVLQEMEETLGPKHISTLISYNNLGLLYKNQDKLAEAEHMLELALRGKEETLGLSHPSTLQTIGNIGIVYYKQSKAMEAEHMYQRALRGKEDVLGSSHKETLETVANLGNLYIDQGKLLEAEHMYKRAFEGFVEVLGPSNALTQETFNKLADVRRRQAHFLETD
jgi:tetratricopeptide (TPR) repeat protein